MIDLFFDLELWKVKSVISKICRFGTWYDDIIILKSLGYTIRGQEKHCHCCPNGFKNALTEQHPEVNSSIGDNSVSERLGLVMGVEEVGSLVGNWMEILSRVASTTPFNFIHARVKSESLESNFYMQSDQNLTMAWKKSESRTIFVAGSLSNAPDPLSHHCPGYCNNVQLP